MKLGFICKPVGLIGIIAFVAYVIFMIEKLHNPELRWGFISGGILFLVIMLFSSFCFNYPTRTRIHKKNTNIIGWLMILVALIIAAALATILFALKNDGAF